MTRSAIARTQPGAPLARAFATPIIVAVALPTLCARTPAAAAAVPPGQFLAAGAITSNVHPGMRDRILAGRPGAGNLGAGSLGAGSLGDRGACRDHARKPGQRLDEQLTREGLR